MNFPLIRQLVLKDVRHQRIQLVLLWLIAYIMPLTTLFYTQQMSDLICMARVIIACAFCLLAIYCWVATLLLDPTCGADRFMTTKPVAWPDLLLSKLLFVLLFVWFPIVIFRVANIWMCGLHVSFADQAIHILEISLSFFAIASALVLPALFFRKFVTVILFVAGAILFAYLAILGVSVIWSTFGLDSVFIYPSIPDGLDPRDPSALSLKISSYLVVCAILVITMVPVAVLRYWRPALPIPVTLVFAGLFLALVYGTTWRIPFTQFASDHFKPVTEIPAPLRDQIHLSPQDLTWDLTRKWQKDNESSQKELEVHLNQLLRIDGITRPYGIWTSAATEASFPSGKTLPSTGGYGYGLHRHYDWREDYLRFECSGVAPEPYFNEADQNQSMTFKGNYPKNPRVADEEWPDASINETIKFFVYRVEILKIEPFRSGARLQYGRALHEVREIAYADGEIQYAMNRSVLPLLLRADLEYFQAQSEEPIVKFAVINRRTGEIIDDDSDSVYVSPFDGFILDWHKLHKPLPPGSPPNAKPPPIPAHWLDDAVICFYHVVSVGQGTTTYTGKTTNVIQ